MMTLDTRYFETGLNPCYLNLGNSAKDYSQNETTNPSTGLLEVMSKNAVVISNTEIQQPIIEELLLIE